MKLAAGPFGVVFTRSVDRLIRLSTTSRADLALDRMAVNPAVSETEAVIITPSIAAAEKVVAVLKRFWTDRGVSNEEGRLSLDLTGIKQSVTLCRKAFNLVGHTRTEYPKPKVRLVAGGGGFDIVEKHSMPDPSMSHSERLHRANKRGADTIEVDVNMTSRLGGMARIRTRTEAHQEAAARFRLVFDRVCNVGPKAIDPSAIRVDGSSEWSRADSLFSQAETAGKHYGALRDALSHRELAISIAIIVHDESVAKAARTVFGADNGGRRRQVTEGLKSALDRIAAHFELMTLPYELRRDKQAA